jgi:hypothetical protein
MEQSNRDVPLHGATDYARSDPMGASALMLRPVRIQEDVAVPEIIRVQSRLRV